MKSVLRSHILLLPKRLIFFVFFARIVIKTYNPRCTGNGWFVRRSPGYWSMTVVDLNFHGSYPMNNVTVAGIIGVQVIPPPRRHRKWSVQKSTTSAVRWKRRRRPWNRPNDIALLKTVDREQSASDIRNPIIAVVPYICVCKCSYVSRKEIKVSVERFSWYDRQPTESGRYPYFCIIILSPRT